MNFTFADICELSTFTLNHPLKLLIITSNPTFAAIISLASRGNTKSKKMNMNGTCHLSEHISYTEPGENHNS